MTGIFSCIRNSTIFTGSHKARHSTESRGGKSRLCKQDVDGKIDLKKLREIANVTSASCDLDL